MERTISRVARALKVAVAGLCVASCSGAGSGGSPPPPAAPTSASTPSPVAAPATAGAAAGSVPAAAAEGGRPGAANPPPRTAPADASVELRAEILRVIGNAPCRNDSQCRAIALGSKPCGGPEGYAAWSTAGTDARELDALAARYKEARQARNQRLGLVSDCAVVPEPPVRCVPAAEAGAAGRCQALPARGGPTPATR